MPLPSLRQADTPRRRRGLCRKEIVALINEYPLPGLYPYRNFVEEGGLVLSAVNIGDLWRREKVGDVPIYQASTFSSSSAPRPAGIQI
jgi:hypothetical protein